MSRRMYLMLGLALLSLGIVRPALADGASWRCFGPYGGPMQSLAFSPAFDQDGIVYAASASGNLFRSEDEGQTWSRMAGLQSASIRASPDAEHLLPERLEGKPPLGVRAGVELTEGALIEAAA